MKPFEARELLKRVTYKPGVKLAFDPGESFGIATLTITSMVQDVNEPSRTIPLTNRQALPPLEYMDRDEFIFRIGDALMRFERHECDEWFRVDGKPVNDPHPESAQIKRKELTV